MFERLLRHRSDSPSFGIDPLDKVIIEGMLIVLPDLD